MAYLNCPSKSSEEWKYLMKELNGNEYAAYRIFINNEKKYNGELPPLKDLKGIVNQYKSFNNEDRNLALTQLVFETIEKTFVEKGIEPTGKQINAEMPKVLSELKKKMDISTSQTILIQRYIQNNLLNMQTEIKSLSTATSIENEDDISLEEDSEATEDNTSDKEIASGSEGVETSSDQKMRNTSKRYRPFITALYNAGIIEPEHHMISFAKEAREWAKENKEYTAEMFDQFLNDFANRSIENSNFKNVITSSTLSEKRLGEVVSLVNEYSGITLRDVDIILRSKPGSKTPSFTNKSISRENTYSNYENKIRRAVSTFTYKGINDSNKALTAAWNDFIKAYDALPIVIEGKRSEENIKKKHEMAVDFLYQITGVRWDAYFNSDNEVFYDKGGNKVSFSASTFADKLPSLFRVTPTGKYSANASDMVFYMLERNLRTKKNDIFESNNAATNLIDYLTNDNKGYTQIRKLTNNIQESKNLMSFNFNGKRQVAAEMNTHLDNVFNNLKDRFKNSKNRLAKFFIENGPGKIKRIQGIRGYKDVAGKNESLDIDANDLSSEEILSTLLIDYFKGEGTYNHWLGVFGDKKKFYTLNIPKSDSKMSIEDKYKALQELMTKEEITEALSDIKSIINNVTLHDGVLNSLYNSEAAKDFAYGFLYDYTLNFADVNEIIHGNYKGYGSNFVKMIKRAGNVISPGIVPDSSVKGGLGETFSHVVVSDPKFTITINGEKVTVDIPDGIQLASKDYMDRLQVSLGTIISKSEEYPDFNCAKLNYSGLDVDNNRLLNKCNTWNVDYLGTSDEGYAKIAKWMKENKIDVLTFSSSAKASPFKKTDLYNEEGRLDKAVDPAANKHDLRTEDLRFQQDLRHSNKPHAEKQPVQLASNFLKYLESLSIQQMSNINQRQFQDDLKKDFGVDELAVFDKIFKGDDFADVRQYLNEGGSLKNPRYRNIIEKKLAAYSTKNAFEKKTNRVALQVVPTIEEELRVSKVITYKGEERVQLAQCIASIDGVREDEEFSMSLEEAISYIHNNKSKYSDMLYTDPATGKLMVREWEILKKGNRVVIPGEMIMLTRIPADHPHSTTMARVKKRISGNYNTVMMDRQSYVISGEDFDGDKRYAETLFKDKDGNTIFGNKSFMGRANASMMGYADIFYNPKYHSELIEGIDKGYFDTLIQEFEGTSKPISNPNNLMHMLNAFNSNKAGRSTIGATANLASVFDLSSKYGLTYNQALYFSINGNAYLLDGVSKDKFGMIKNIIGGLLNLATDNGNEQKIDKINYNEIVAPLAIFMIASNTKLETINNRDEYANELKKHVYDVMRFIAQPHIQAFIDEKRSSKGLNSKNANDFELINKLSLIYPDKFKDFIPLWSASREFMQIMDLIKMTREVPKTVYDYLSAVDAYDKFINSILYKDLKGVNKFSKINVNAFVDENNKPVIELDMLKENIDYSRYYVFNNSLQLTSKVENIIDLIKARYQTINNDNDKSMILTKKMRERIGNLLEKMLMINSISGTKTPRQVFTGLKDAIDNKAKYVGKDGITNKFLESIQIVNEIVRDKNSKENIVNTRIQILEALKENDALSNKNTLNEIWEDFDLLPEALKNDFMHYQIFQYGLTTSNFKGSYMQLFSPKYHQSISEDIDKEYSKYNKNITSTNNEFEEGIIDFYLNLYGKRTTRPESENPFSTKNELHYILNTDRGIVENNWDNKFLAPIKHAIDHVIGINGIEGVKAYDYLISNFDALTGSKISDVREVKEEDVQMNNDTDKDVESTERLSVSQYRMNSGGAEGADKTFSAKATEYNLLNQFNYRYSDSDTYGNVSINDSEKNNGIVMMNKAAKIKSEAEGKNKPNTTSEAGKFVIRDYAQVSNSDAVFAIAEKFVEVSDSIRSKNNTNQQRIVSGGTGWAVQYAIMDNKPVYVFDQVTKMWYAYDKNVGDFVEYKSDSGSNIPLLTKNFAGIGTRKINQDGKNAIDGLFKNTFPEKEDVIKFNLNTPEYSFMSMGDMDAPFKTDKGTEIKSVMHYVTASKVKDANLKQMILNAETASKVVEIKNEYGIGNLDNINLELGFIEKAYRYKFESNPELKQKLVDTGDALLYAVMNDKLLGIATNVAGGQNQLGKLLMRLREEYKKDDKGTPSDVTVSNIAKQKVGEVELNVVTNEANEAVDTVEQVDDAVKKEVIEKYNQKKKPAKKETTFEEVTQEDIDMFYDVTMPMQDIEAVEAGKKTGTSRPLDSTTKNIKKGKIVKFFNKEKGTEVFVLVTSDMYAVKSIDAAKWAQIENTIDKSKYQSLVDKGAYQFTFSVISGRDKLRNEVRTSSLTKVSYDKNTEEIYKGCKGL